MHHLERVPTEVEKVVLNSDTIEPQNVTPDCGNLFLEFGARRSEWLFKIRSSEFGRRQRGAIHFAVRRGRKRLQPDKRRRNHVVRKLVLKAFGQLRLAAALAEQIVADEPPLALGHHSVSHGGMLA